MAGTSLLSSKTCEKENAITMSTIILILGAALLLALIGVLMNRARTRSGNAHHDGGGYIHHGDSGGSSHHSGTAGGREASHDGGGSDWGDSGSGGDGGGGDGGGSGGGDG